MPSTTAGPELTELPAANCQRIAPVAASSANIWSGPVFAIDDGVDDAVRRRHRGEVPHADDAEAGHGLDLGIGRLPEDLSGLRIERRPGAAGDGRVRDHAVLASACRGCGAGS